MIEVLKQLRVLQIESGKTQQNIADETGLAKSTINRILAGKTEEVKLQTVIDIAACLNAEVALASTNSKNAIDQQDITYYRDAMDKRDERIAKLENAVAKRDSQIEEKDQAINRKDAYIKAKDKEISRITQRLDRNGRTILILSLAVSVLALLCIYLIFDGFNGHWGIFRY